MTVLSGGKIQVGPEIVVRGVRFLTFRGSFVPHVLQPLLLNSPPRPDVIVDDLAHSVPWGSERISRSPGTVFFRHLHQRTLDGQIRAPFAGALKWIERRYRYVYPSWTFVTESLQGVTDLVNLGIGEDRVSRIPPGVDTSLFSIGVPAERPLLVYFGGLRPYKRPGHALECLKHVRDQGLDCQLVIVGSGPMLESLRSAAANLGVGSHVIFAGRLSNPDLADLVRRSWVNLHCSTAEGWCLSALEAAAAGVPTVGYRVPGLSESVSEDSGGLLVREADPNELAKAVSRVIDTRAIRAQKCRAYAQRFSWDKTVRLWAEHLDSVAN